MLGKDLGLKSPLIASRSKLEGTHGTVPRGAVSDGGLAPWVLSPLQQPGITKPWMV